MSVGARPDLIIPAVNVNWSDVESSAFQTQPTLPKRTKKRRTHSAKGSSSRHRKSAERGSRPHSALSNRSSTSITITQRPFSAASHHSVTGQPSARPSTAVGSRKKKHRHIVAG